MKHLLSIVILFVASQSFAQDLTYNLSSKMDAQVTLEDSTTTKFWGYGLFFSDPQQSNVTLPSPTLFGNYGDSVHINFHNVSPEAHTIHLHGLDVDQANDGVPSTSFNIMPNQSTTYSFESPHPGMYLYHCHVTTTWHLAMGMYGSVIIVDPDHPDEVYPGGPTFEGEYTFLTSEFDLSWNEDPLSAYPFNTFEADYFMVNGKSGQQLFASNRNVVEVLEGDSVLLRVGNMGYSKTQWRFPTALNATVHMSDGRPLPNAWRTDTLDVYPGERFEVLLTPETSIYDWITVEHHYLYEDQVIGSNLVGVNASSLPNSVEEQVVSDLMIYPNPSRGAITVEGSKSAPAYIVNMSGQVVKRLFLQKGANQITLESLNPGVYLILGENIKQKFIIQ